MFHPPLVMIGDSCLSHWVCVELAGDLFKPTPRVCSDSCNLTGGTWENKNRPTFSFLFCCASFLFCLIFLSFTFRRGISSSVVLSSSSISSAAGLPESMGLFAAEPPSIEFMVFQVGLIGSFDLPGRAADEGVLDLEGGVGEDTESSVCLEEFCGNVVHVSPGLSKVSEAEVA